MSFREIKNGFGKPFFNKKRARRPFYLQIYQHVIHISHFLLEIICPHLAVSGNFHGQKRFKFLHLLGIFAQLPIMI